jgi:putative selenate reductase
MKQLASWVFNELEHRNRIFGLPHEMFHHPAPVAPYAGTVYGQALDTPLGVAAGPHSQMAQNIITAWLCGARFMELKTVQTLDELEVSKPCIDMQDEGYNVEWSQELKIQQSFEEYLRAWVLIHALHHKLEFPGSRPGMIFNLSVGYNLEGIQQDNVQWFLKHMQDPGDRFDEYLDEVKPFVPDIYDLDIPRCLSDNVTVSTMHGCPPDEIGKICHYLMKEWKLHTNVKLNPTLLGPDRVRYILNDALGYTNIQVPDLAFEHDLKYPDALALLSDLQAAAPECGVTFGIKLCNTLEVMNHRRIFSADNEMMYMSGRPHHALAVNLAARLIEDMSGPLPMSFAGGADAFNLASLLAAGMQTVTTCSDILRPGGYSRMNQYLEETANAMKALEADDLPSFILKQAGRTDDDVTAATYCNLRRYAEAVLSDPRLLKDRYQRTTTKTDRSLHAFDCIMAPCSDTCPITQQVPQYMQAVLDKRYDDAIDITRQDNTLAAILGRACNHRCEYTCTRTHYDEPLAIREIKRFIMEQESTPRCRERKGSQHAKVAIVGGGPCGLSAAYFLAQAGYPVTIYEARPYTGGMVSGSIPGYRATQEVINQDMAVFNDLGVEILYNQKVGRDISLLQLREENKYVIIAGGAQDGMPLGLDNENADGVIDGLAFLRAVREGNPPALGERVGIIGGGDVAMDCARSALRSGGNATIIYRRTMAQMPAQKEELDGLLEEGIPIRELYSPKAIETENGKLTALVCDRMQLGEPDDSGRRRPVPTGEEEAIPLDQLIIAIGQRPDLSLFNGEPIECNRKGYIQVDPITNETSLHNVFAGGDIIMEGPDTIVKALGDGKLIAKAIRKREEERLPQAPPPWPPVDEIALLQRRARRQDRVAIPHRGSTDRNNFKEVVETLSEAEAHKEAGRCLRCDLMCSTCATVCPNRAIISYPAHSYEILVPSFLWTGEELTRQEDEVFQAIQPYQIAILTDFCNECGNCATFCPTAGKPYRDKPRFYLRQTEFEAEDNNAFQMSKTDKGWVINGRFNGETHTVELIDSEVAYTSPILTCQLDLMTFRIIHAQPRENCPEDQPISLEPCAIMSALVMNLSKATPHIFS